MSDISFKQNCVDTAKFFQGLSHLIECDIKIMDWRGLNECFKTDLSMLLMKLNSHNKNHCTCPSNL